MNIVLFYFSGTGNTEKAAKKWKESAANFDINIDLVKIEKNDFDFANLDKYDKIGFAYPVHAFNAPENVWKFAKKFPKLENQKKVFLVMVSGEYMTINHSSGKKLLRILKKKNIV